MIDRNIIDARIRRSGILECAGKFLFRDVNSDIVKSLDLPTNFEFLLALIKSKQCWTAVSTTKLLYRVNSSEGCIEVSGISEKFHNFYFEREKGEDIEFVELNQGAVQVWVGNSSISFALQNILMLLERQH